MFYAKKLGNRIHIYVFVYFKFILFIYLFIFCYFILFYLFIYLLHKVLSNTTFLNTSIWTIDETLTDINNPSQWT